MWLVQTNIFIFDILLFFFFLQCSLWMSSGIYSVLKCYILLRACTSPLIYTTPNEGMRYNMYERRSIFSHNKIQKYPRMQQILKEGQRLLLSRKMEVLEPSSNFNQADCIYIALMKDKPFQKQQL